MKAIVKNSCVDSEEDEKWKIESDARRIEDYVELKSDKGRFNKAIKFLETKKTNIEKVISSGKNN